MTEFIGTIGNFVSLNAKHKIEWLCLKLTEFDGTQVFLRFLIYCLNFIILWWSYGFDVQLLISISTTTTTCYFRTVQQDLWQYLLNLHYCWTQSAFLVPLYGQLEPILCICPLLLQMMCARFCDNCAFGWRDSLCIWLTVYLPTKCKPCKVFMMWSLLCWKKCLNYFQIIDEHYPQMIPEKLGGNSTDFLRLALKNVFPKFKIKDNLMARH